jgi:hypothetical protein
MCAGGGARVHVEADGTHTDSLLAAMTSTRSTRVTMDEVARTEVELASPSTTADELARQKEEELLAQNRARRVVLDGHSPATWLHKRGGVLNTWKKRWAVVEHGVLYFYVSPDDRLSAKPGLGAIVLKNATVRRPTDLSHKGKHKDTCFRLDTERAAQAAVIASYKGGDGDSEDELAAADAAGRVSKTKWVLAAETPDEMDKWMSDLTFWASEEGTRLLESELDFRRRGKSISDDERARIRTESMTEAAAAEQALTSLRQQADAEQAAAAPTEPPVTAGRNRGGCLGCAGFAELPSWVSAPLRWVQIA